jgi:hypothetical protein
MEQTSPDILMGIGKIRDERMITLSLQSVLASPPVSSLPLGFPDKERDRKIGEWVFDNILTQAAT